MSLTGAVFDISRACVDDGPGLRTVVFFKGCPLACPWCHNPEGRSPLPQLFYERARCLGCDPCQGEGCPTGARRVVGRRLEQTALVEEALEDLDFFRGTGGGVTFSGGEPLAQPRFLFACAGDLRRAGVHLALETSGCWDGELAEEVARRFDLVLFDLKHTDGDRFREATGQPVWQALDNLAALAASGVGLELRLTLVPGFNDRPEDLELMATWLKESGVDAPITLQPFHRLAASKQAMLGVSYAYQHVPPVTGEQLSRATGLLRTAGILAEDVTYLAGPPRIPQWARRPGGSG